MLFEVNETNHRGVDDTRTTYHVAMQVERAQRVMNGEVV